MIIILFNKRKKNRVELFYFYSKFLPWHDFCVIPFTNKRIIFIVTSLYKNETDFLAILYSCLIGKKKEIVFEKGSDGYKKKWNVIFIHKTIGRVWKRNSEIGVKDE